jgi:predicted dithiol-disulfide oxidoreductase (DUF899 family)
LECGAEGTAFPTDDASSRTTSRQSARTSSETTWELSSQVEIDFVGETKAAPKGAALQNASLSQRNKDCSTLPFLECGAEGTAFLKDDASPRTTSRQSARTSSETTWELWSYLDIDFGGETKAAPEGAALQNASPSQRNKASSTLTFLECGAEGTAFLKDDASPRTTSRQSARTSSETTWELWSYLDIDFGGETKAAPEGAALQNASLSQRNRASSTRPFLECGAEGTAFPTDDASPRTTPRQSARTSSETTWELWSQLEIDFVGETKAAPEGAALQNASPSQRNKANSTLPFLECGA